MNSKPHPQHGGIAKIFEYEQISSAGDVKICYQELFIMENGDAIYPMDFFGDNRMSPEDHLKRLCGFSLCTLGKFEIVDSIPRGAW